MLSRCFHFGVLKFLFPVCFFWYFSLSRSIDIQHFTTRKQILKKSITVKWQCPEFKGNESYAFKLLRTESKNGQPSYDADDVVGVFCGRRVSRHGPSHRPMPPILIRGMDDMQKNGNNL